jgi:hypothetical protein
VTTSPLDAIEDVLSGARCWGIELDPRYRVLAVTVEPDPLRAPGTPGEHQLLCFPVSTFLVALTRPAPRDPSSEDSPRTALLTFELEQLTAVSERLGGASIVGPVLGRPEPRPGAWGPRYSLEGRSSAPDGTRSTLTLDLTGDDGARLRLFARFDEVELRDAARTLVLGTTGGLAAGGVVRIGEGERTGAQDGVTATAAGTEGSPSRGEEDPSDPLRF